MAKKAKEEPRSVRESNGLKNLKVHPETVRRIVEEQCTQIGIMGEKITQERVILMGLDALRREREKA